MSVTLLCILGGILIGLGARGRLKGETDSGEVAPAIEALNRARADLQEAMASVRASQENGVDVNALAKQLTILRTRLQADVKAELALVTTMVEHRGARSRPPASVRFESPEPSGRRSKRSSRDPRAVPAELQASPLLRFLKWWNASRPTRSSINGLLRQQPIDGLRLQALKSQAPFVAVRTTPALYPGLDVLILPDMNQVTYGMQNLFDLRGQLGETIHQVIEPARVSHENYRPGMTDRLLELGLQRGRLH